MYGQSQAANAAEARRVGPIGAYAFHDGRCYHLRDPVPGATGAGGSIWPAFARTYGRPVVIINGAVGGASIDQLLGDPLRRLQQDIALARHAGLRPALTIYMQGETDAASRTSAGVYLAKLRTLRRQLPGQWIVMLNSRCYDEPVWPALNVARALLAATDPLVAIGPEMDSLRGEYRRDDNCHLNAAGQSIVGEALGRAVRGYL